MVRQVYLEVKRKFVRMALVLFHSPPPSSSSLPPSEAFRGLVLQTCYTTHPASSECGVLTISITSVALQSRFSELSSGVVMLRPITLPREQRESCDCRLTRSMHIHRLISRLVATKIYPLQYIHFINIWSPRLPPTLAHVFTFSVSCDGDQIGEAGADQGTLEAGRKNVPHTLKKN